MMEYLMKKINRYFGVKYFLWSIGLVSLLLICGASFSIQGWSYIRSYYTNYIGLACLHFIVAFMPQKIRETAFLIMLLFSITALLNFSFNGKYLFPDAIYGMTLMVAIPVTMLFWFHGRQKGKHLERVVMAGLLSLAMPFIINAFDSRFWTYFWVDFWVERVYFISFIAINTVSILIGILLCYCRTKKSFVIAVLPLLPIAVWSSFHLRSYIATYLLYGTPTGKTERIITTMDWEALDSLSRKHAKENAVYRVALIWETDRDNNTQFDVREFERASGLFHHRENMELLIMGVTSRYEREQTTDLWTLYKKHHFTLPLHEIKNDWGFWKEVDAKTLINSLVCVFKKDTLIYKNDLKHAIPYLKTLK